MAAAFGIAVTIVILGWLWFFVVRPILEDFGIIRTGEHMSSSERVRSVPAVFRTEPRLVRPPEPLPVPQPWDQHEPDRSVDFEGVRGWLIEHNLTDEQAIELFATARRATGDYFLSANKIREGVGGSRDEVLAQVAALRPKPPAPKPKAHLDRPVNGWK